MTDFWFWTGAIVTLWLALIVFFILFARGASSRNHKPFIRVSCKVRGEELITNEYLSAALRGDA